jgi:hypothetical protein
MELAHTLSLVIGIKKQDIPDWQQLTVAATAGVISVRLASCRTL